MSTETVAVKSPTPEVYAAIAAVQTAMAREGISKDRKNTSQGYQFRGIDDVYSALAPHLAANGLCILPRVLEANQTERETKSGSTLIYTLLKVAFDFVAVKDGSVHTVVMIGEAMDSGDKSSNKAMSAAYKYAAFQAFAIPTEGDNDADATTHEPTAKKQPTAKTAPTKSAQSGEPLTAQTRKDLEFVINTPKGAELWAKATKSKGVTLETIDESTAQKALSWMNAQINAA